MPPYAVKRRMFHHEDEGSASDHSSSSISSKKDDERKNKRDHLQACISATIDYLDHNGIAKSSIAELRLAFSKSRFLPAMRRIQDYMECYTENSLVSSEEKQAAAYMVLQAWRSLLDYTRFVHRRVYAEYNDLLANPNIPKRLDLLREKLQHMNKVAEYTCGSQSGFLRATKWESRTMAVTQQ